MNKEQKDFWIAGVDEAGRGPLAGPVIAAAVILPPTFHIPHLTDSKKLTEQQRETLFAIIYEQALAVGVGRAEVEEIDQINILQASLLAMKRAVENLAIKPHLAIIDGNCCPKLVCETKAIIRGDETEPAISAASVIAKVTRDREMLKLDAQFPEFGFAQHKGYATKMHYERLRLHGPCLIHRRSFAPVRELLDA